MRAMTVISEQDGWGDRADPPSADQARRELPTERAIAVTGDLVVHDRHASCAYKRVGDRHRDGRAS